MVAGEQQFSRPLLEAHGLGKHKRKKLKTFSKGMAQKVQVLAAIAHEPDLIIFDEPFSGLDPVNQRGLEETIRAQAAAGRTILFSTHVMEQAEKLCDRIALIYRGRKLLDGTVKEIKNAYRDRVPLPPPVEPEPELEKIFIKAVEESGLVAPDTEELQ